MYRLSRYGLGDATATAAIATICPAGPTAAPCQNATYQQFLQQAVSTRFLPLPDQTNASTTCSGVQTTGAASAAKGLNITSTAAKAGASILSLPAIASATAAAGPLAPIVAGVALVTGLITQIFAKHAQAEALQANILCTAVPQTNAALQAIDQGLASGSISPSQGQASYASLLAQFSAGVKADPSYKTGDALWGFLQALMAIVAARNLDLQNGVLTGGAPGPWTSAGASAGAAGIAASLGISSTDLPWIVLGGAAALAFLL